MSKEKTLKIAFVPAAGSPSRKVWFCGILLPRFAQWRIFNFLIRLPGTRVKYYSEINRETWARLNKVLELYREAKIDEVFLVGGYMEKCAYSTSHLMKRWLSQCFKGIPEKKMHVGDKSADSRGHAEELFAYLTENNIKLLELHIVTSWYHSSRAGMNLYREWTKALPACETVKPIYHDVKPPFSGEYLFNIITEPLKVFLDMLKA